MADKTDNEMSRPNWDKTQLTPLKLCPKPPQQFVSEIRPKVKVSKNIETTVEYTLTDDELAKIVTAYVKKVYPEFRRRNLSVEVEVFDNTVRVHGYCLET